MRYTYLGDRLTRPDLKGAQCDPVRRADGKCVISQTMPGSLVVFENGEVHAVLRRCLRVNPEARAEDARRALARRREYFRPGRNR